MDDLDKRVREDEEHGDDEYLGDEELEISLADRGDDPTSQPGKCEDVLKDGNVITAGSAFLSAWR